VAAEDPDHLEARLRLANVLEEQGKKAEALEIVTEGMSTLNKQAWVTNIPVLRRRAQQGSSRSHPKASRADKAAQRNLTKRMLEDQMRQTMGSLWQEVLVAEQMLDDGDVGALDMFIQSAGTMIDNHRMAKHMFTRHRVGGSFKSSTICCVFHSYGLGTVSTPVEHALMNREFKEFPRRN
jgi:general transcription factor 3C polypeptide 3 (transcription factor C subunit 4)